MKYTVFFAATAAAYDAYGTKPEAAPKCLTTITPGYGKYPVTITKQHQPYPTCITKNYDGKTCDKWGEDYYVDTTVNDYNGKPVHITKYDQPVTVYYEKKTITHSETAKGYGAYATPAGGYAYPTAGPEYKISEDGCWYELYEKIEYAPYNKLGAHALKGYPGSGLCKESDTEQYVNVKEYKNGKWSHYKDVHHYGTPKPYVTNYPKAGTYNVPGKTVTVDKTVYYAAETTRYGKAGETCTYGGKYINAEKTGYLTAGYADYEYKNGKKENVLKYTTVYATKTGAYEICKPTVTVWDKDTTYVVPTASYYKPGVYHYKPQVVTVTKDNYDYTCAYEKWAKPTSYPLKPAKPYQPAYPTAAYPAGYKPAQPAQPYYPASNGSYPAGYAYPSGAAYPVKPASYKPAEPCDEYGNPIKPATGYPVKPVEGEHYYPGKPVEGEKGYYPPTKPVDATKYPATTPCPEDDKKVYPAGYPYNGKPVDSETVYPAKPVEGEEGYYPPGKPVEGEKGYYPPGKPVEGETKYPAGYPYNGKPVDSETKYPAKPVSGEEPCDEEKPGYKSKSYSS